MRRGFGFFDIKKKFTTENALKTLGIELMRPPLIIHPTQLANKQWGELTERASDHQAAEFSLKAFEHECVALSYNIRMQGRGGERSNSAYGDDEDDETYQARYIRMLDTLRQHLIAHPEIAVVALQEAPNKHHLAKAIHYINTSFPAEWQIAMNPDIKYDATDWGVFTLFNTKKLRVTQLTNDPTMTEGLPIKDLPIRCRTFTLQRLDGVLIQMTHLHLPHGRDSAINEAEQAFMAFMANVFSALIQKGVKNETASHILIGDWNIEPERVETLLQTLADMQSPQLQAQISAKLTASKNGHLKQNKTFKTVDLQLELEVRPAPSFDYSFDFRSNRTRLGFAGICLAVAGIGVTGFDSEEDRENSNPVLETTRAKIG
jgi:exonuclease III